MMTRWRCIVALASVVFVAGSCTPETPVPSNQAPHVEITATPTTGTAPLSVAFSSAGTVDPDGTIATYAWTFGDGGTSNLPNPTHIYNAASTFEAILVVTDNGGKTATTSVIITVTGPGNQSPTAVASADPTSGTAPLAVDLSSTGSVDGDGTIASYDWDFGDGSPHSSLPSPSHTYAAGSHVAVLTVTDNEGATGTDSVLITVAANQSPIAAASVTPTSGNAPLAVTFSSAGTVDNDGTIASYDWDFGDGTPHSNLPSPSHTYTAIGLVTATLTVTDNGGATDTATASVQVNANQLPTAVATSDVTSGPAPLTVAFAGSASTDNDGTIASYAWNFGDGNTSPLADVSHTYSTPGPYNATLTITDNDGGVDVATISITVGPPPNQTPDAQASATPLVRLVGQTFSFSSAGSVDPDGTIASYLWSFGDSQISTAPNPTHAYTTPATYTVTLTVTDNNGATDTDTVQVQVNPNDAPTAVATGSNTSGKAPLTVGLVGSASTDSDGTIASYDWDFGDGSPHGTTADLSHTYTSVGNFTATLTVTDDLGATDSSTVSVSVIANQPPSAALNSDITSGLAPLVVNFNSNTSIDPDGTIVSRSLSFGDGSPNSTSTAVSHTYTGAGTYTATLTVVDDNGAFATASKVITVIGTTISPTSGPTGTTISVTVPCQPAVGQPLIATAMAALVVSPGVTVVATGTFDNGTTGNANAVVTLLVPGSAAPGSYVVTSSCDRYMSSTTYAPVAFTVT